MFRYVPSVLFSPRSGWTQLRTQADHKHWGSIPVLLLLSLIPAICTYIGTAYVGWEMFGSADNRLMTPASAALLAFMVYVGYIVGAVIMSFMVRWVLYRTPGRPSLPISLTFVTFVATPLMLAGVAAAFPYRFVIVGTGIAAAIYAVWLLFRGLPVFMHLERNDQTRFRGACIVALGFLVTVTTAYFSQHIWRTSIDPVSAVYIGSQEADQGLNVAPEE